MTWLYIDNIPFYIHTSEKPPHASCECEDFWQHFRGFLNFWCFQCQVLIALFRPCNVLGGMETQPRAFDSVSPHLEWDTKCGSLHGRVDTIFWIKLFIICTHHMLRRRPNTCIRTHKHAQASHAPPLPHHTHTPAHTYLICSLRLCNISLLSSACLIPLCIKHLMPVFTFHILLPTP